MSPLEVRRNVGAFFVGHPQFSRVEREIESLLDLGHSGGEADCALVTSPAGTGKTTLFYRLKAAYTPDNKSSRRKIAVPKSPTEVTARYVPVLFYEVPSPPRPLAVIQGLLKELGDPNWSTGRLSDCSHRLDDFLKDCGTTAIVLDEVQRLVDQTGVITSETILEEMKRIHGRHKLNLIFLGLGRIKCILEGDPQLRDRWSLELRLLGFECYRYKIDGETTTKDLDTDQWQVWLGVLNALQVRTGLISSEPLSSEEYAKRLYYATAGVMRRLKILLRRALKLLSDECSDEVTLDVLGRAFDDVAKGRANPFTTELIDSLPLPVIDDDYKLKKKPRKRPERRQADVLADNVGASIARVLGR